MCGIAGWTFTGTPTKRDWVFLKAFLTNLAVETQARGPHATGFASWTTKGRMFVKKAALPAEEFVKLPVWKRRALSAKSVIVHCRFATHGDPARNENNHPFTQGRYALIHNGVIGSYKTLARTHDVTLLTECDSEVILRIVAKYAKGKNLRDGMEKWAQSVAYSSGDYAIAVLDKKTGRVRLMRNEGRPLAIVKIPAVKLVAFASTPEIINKAFMDALKELPNKREKQRVNVTATGWNCGPDKIYLLEPGNKEVEHETINVPRRVISTHRPYTAWPWGDDSEEDGQELTDAEIQLELELDDIAEANKRADRAKHTYFRQYNKGNRNKN